MSKTSIVGESVRLYYVGIGLLVLTWTYVAVEVAQYAVVQLFNNLVGWFVPAISVFATLILPISLVAWRAKKSIIFEEPKWHFETREVSYFEYRNMMNDYRRSYSMLLARLENGWLSVFMILFVTALMLPFILLAISAHLIWLTPYLFGGLVLISGIIIAIFIFNLTSNDATHYFSYKSPSLLEQVIQMLGITPGISWVGVQLKIGEAEGYFTIQEPRVVARIEGIEGAAKIIAVTDEVGTLKNAKSILKMEDDEQEIKFSFEPRKINSSEALLRLVRETLQRYVDARGSDEIIEEVLEDLGIKTISNNTRKGDELISG